MHVVLRTHPDVGTLRSDVRMWALREALIALATRVEAFRVVHISVQRTHVHLIVEARDNVALSRGMQAFAISAAKHLNASLAFGGGERRRGTVFPDRYHATQLGSPRQVRNTIAYVLNNWRHHGEHRRVSWALDKYASALGFDGWKEDSFIQPPGYVKPMVWEPETWLLRVGWRRRGLIATDEVPGLTE